MKNKLIWTKINGTNETMYTLNIEYGKCVVVSDRANIYWYIATGPIILTYIDPKDAAYANSVKQAKRSAINALRRRCKYYIEISSKILKKIKNDE